MEKERSKRIYLYDKEKELKVNDDNLQWFRKYQVNMSLKDLSPNTINQYNADLKQWFIFMYDKQFNLSVLKATEDDITEYYYWRKKEGNNVNRQKRVMSSISAFYKFLRKKKAITEDPTEFIDRPKEGLPVIPQTYLTKEDVENMRQILNDYGDIQLLTYAFLSLTTMGRVNAIAHLRWDQQDEQELLFKDVVEKENKIVDLSYTEEVDDYLKQLKKYRKDNNIDDHGWVFITNNTTDEQCVSNGTLLDWCKKIGLMIGYPTLHCHDFRHSYSNLLKQEGIALEDISSMLNHSGTDVTKKHYLKTDSSQIRKLKNSVKI